LEFREGTGALCHPMERPKSPSLFISRRKDPQASNEKIVEEVFLESWNEDNFVVALGIIVSRD
ncbi:hypothetical protein Taro_052314, partial [Colocasia esculenta]|nr:hypothetical protein [Colocasia esculenta]